MGILESKIFAVLFVAEHKAGYKEKRIFDNDLTSGQVFGGRSGLHAEIPHCIGLWKTKSIPLNCDRKWSF